MYRRPEDQVAVLESRGSLNDFRKVIEGIYATLERVKREGESLGRLC
jgi:hypothetical protein